MAVLNNGLQLLGVGADLTQIIKGLVLLTAVAFDVYNKRQGKPSITGLLLRLGGGGKPQRRRAGRAGPRDRQEGHVRADPQRVLTNSPPSTNHRILEEKEKA